MDKAVADQDFTDPSLLEAARQVQELVNLNTFIKGYNGLSNDEAKVQFMNGKSAMFVTGTWELPDFTTTTDIAQEFKVNIGYFKFPIVVGGKGNVDDWVGGPGTGLFVSKNSKHALEAKIRQLFRSKVGRAFCCQCWRNPGYQSRYCDHQATANVH